MNYLAKPKDYYWDSHLDLQMEMLKAKHSENPKAKLMDWQMVKHSDYRLGLHSDSMTDFPKGYSMAKKKVNPTDCYSEKKMG